MVGEVSCSTRGSAITVWQHVLGMDAAKRGWVGIVLDADGGFVQAVASTTIRALVAGQEDPGEMDLSRT
jgi:hypothetical protein